MVELLWILLRPSSLLAALIVLALLALRVRWNALGRSLLTVALALLLAPALLPVSELLAAPLEERVPFPASLPGRVDGIIVLGGAVDWSVSRARDQLSLDGAAERLMAGAALATRYPEAALVFTGVFAEVLQHDFRADPDPRSFFFGPAFAGRRVVVLPEARSTYEEALLALERLEPRAGQTWLLVTSALHMPRALATFETLGWSVVAYPVDYRSTGEPRFRPDLDIGRALERFDTVVREWGALLVYERSGRSRGALD